MRPLSEAQAEVLDAMAPLPVKEVSLREAAGLVLAEPVVAGHDIPPFANSAMDGYAVRSEDVGHAPVTLTVVEDVPAGSVATRRVQAGEAIKIMTGAPMPLGADTVVKVEDTSQDGAEVTIGAATVAGTSVRPAGGDIAAGTTVLMPGVRLGPAHLGMLASLGVAHPRVRRRPLVGIMSTGDEVVPPETARLGPGAIRDSNRPLLRGLLEELGAVVVDFGIVPDDARALRSALGHAASECDVVVTSGGVSMGEYDLVKAILSDLGTVDFWRVAMQPAKPFAFGEVAERPFFGLPGNPVSVMVAFEQFLRPAVLTAMGAERVFRPRVRGILDEPVRTDPKKEVFLRVELRHDGDWRARLSGGQSSNVLSALANADAFAVVPAGTGVLSKGDAVTLEMFRWPEMRTRDEVLGDR